MIQGQTLTGIADAIRAQLGTEQQYTPESMAAAIGSIQGGGEDSATVDALIQRSLAGSFFNRTATFVGTNAMSNITKLEKVYMVSATELAGSAFSSCTSLIWAAFDSLNVINSSVFAGTKLQILVLRNANVCNLTSARAFDGAPIASGGGYIYVPDDLVEQYKVATNWATYANQIKGLSEIPAEVQEWLDQQGGASA